MRPMTARDVFDEGCDRVAGVVRRAAGADLGRPTPCGWDLRGLVNHFAGTTGALTRVGARQPLDPDDPWGSASDITSTDWSATLTSQLHALSVSWSPPEAWQGSLAAAGPEMPATSLGEIALMEVVVHGWDLARSTGNELRVSPALGAEVYRSVADTAKLGRQMGAYGPPVWVSKDASDLDKALGAAGRDPAWRG